MNAVAIGQVISVVAAAIKTAVDLGPIVIKGVKDAEPFAEVIVRTIMGTQITDEQLTALEEQLNKLSEELQQPLPPADEQDI